MSKGLQIAIGAVAVACLLGWYAWSHLDSVGGYQYFQTVEEFHASGDLPDGRPLRLHGFVAEGSIERDVAGKQVRFAVQNDPPHAGGAAGPVVQVQYLSLETPDMFKDGAEVVVEGRIQAAGSDGRPLIVADNVLAKCPSKFQARAEAES